MSDNGNGNTEHGPRREQCPMRRRGRAAVTAAFLVTVGAVAAVIATLSVTASAHGGFPGFGHHRSIDGPEDLADRAGFAVAWVLGTVDASDDQRERIESIVDEAAADLYPLVAAHRARHETMVTALARPTVDRDALEQVRREELAAADAISERLLDAAIEAAAVLTPEQRQDLLAHAARWHR